MKSKQLNDMIINKKDDTRAYIEVQWAYYTRSTAYIHTRWRGNSKHSYLNDSIPLFIFAVSGIALLREQLAEFRGTSLSLSIRLFIYIYISICPIYFFFGR